MNLFQLGDFKLSSGKQSGFKIECDALTDEDWRTIAFLIGHSEWFGSVVGVPTGGLKLAELLQPYINKESHLRLVVDDVLTTGNSITKMMESPNDMGFVVFSRTNKLPINVTAMFTMYG